jgi:salicylate hydroxylase
MGSLEIESSPLQVAIVGTGIAGLTAAIALRKHPHIHVELYEKATELKEIGASITLGPNGLRTLQRLGLEDCISDIVGLILYPGSTGIGRRMRLLARTSMKMFPSHCITLRGFIEDIYNKPY